MPTSYMLRPATPEDLSFQAKLYATTREEEMNAAQFPPDMRGAFVSMQFQAQTAHYTASYPAAEWSVIECDGVPAGRVIMNRGDDCFNIIDLALLPEYRGRGVGSAILADILAQAHAMNLPSRLFAISGERAIRLYHRLGFQDVKDDGLHTELVWWPKPSQA